MTESFDVVVIGSGFGGRHHRGPPRFEGLSRPRARARTPLDARRRFRASPDDPWLWDHRKPEKCNGWFDFRVFPNMTVVQGAGVGGGSLVYANISVNAKPRHLRQGLARRDHLRRARAALRRRAAR